MHKVDSGKGLGNARGRRKPSISECTHTDDIQHVRNVRNKKVRPFEESSSESSLYFRKQNANSPAVAAAQRAGTA